MFERFEVRFWDQMRCSNVFEVRSSKVRNVRSSFFGCSFHLYLISMFLGFYFTKNWNYLHILQINCAYQFIFLLPTLDLFYWQGPDMSFYICRYRYPIPISVRTLTSYKVDFQNILSEILKPFTNIKESDRKLADLKIVRNHQIYVIMLVINGYY